MDDSPLILEATRQALTADGHDVEVAATYAELESAWAANEFDLVLMDVQMPELFGDDVAMALRDVRGAKIPIYLYSTLPPDELESRAAEAGIDGYINKSDGLDVVVERVREIFAATSR
jgi:DNA-binding response OmpR family regulator